MSFLTPEPQISPLILHHGAFRVEISPEAGALIRRITWMDEKGAGHDLLRLRPADSDSPDLGAAPDDRPGAPHRFGLWPLVPFANRAFGAVIDDGEQRFSLPVNDPATGAAIHGFGWQNAWAVTHSTERQLKMTHTHHGPDYPYDYSAWMSVMILDDAVKIELGVTHLADQPLPYGLGLHPWFPARADTRLVMRADGELTLGEGYRATGITDFADDGPYSDGPLFGSDHETAHSFLKWSGVAEIITPSMGLALHLSASPSLRYPVVWAPAQADFLCIEPQSHAIGAPSERAAREATPLVKLAKNQTLSGWIQIKPRRIAQDAGPTQT